MGKFEHLVDFFTSKNLNGFIGESLSESPDKKSFLVKGDIVTQDLFKEAIVDEATLQKVDPKNLFFISAGGFRCYYENLTFLFPKKNTESKVSLKDLKKILNETFCVFKVKTTETETKIILFEPSFKKIEWGLVEMLSLQGFSISDIKNSEFSVFKSPSGLNQDILRVFIKRNKDFLFDKKSVGKNREICFDFIDFIKPNHIYLEKVEKDQNKLTFSSFEDKNLLLKKLKEDFGCSIKTEARSIVATLIFEENPEVEKASEKEQKLPLKAKIVRGSKTNNITTVRRLLKYLDISFFEFKDKGTGVQIATNINKKNNFVDGEICVYNVFGGKKEEHAEFRDSVIKKINESGLNFEAELFGKKGLSILIKKTNPKETKEEVGAKETKTETLEVAPKKICLSYSWIENTIVSMFQTLDESQKRAIIKELEENI